MRTLPVPATHFVDRFNPRGPEAICDCGNAVALTLLPDRRTFRCNRCRIVARLRATFGKEDVDTFLDLIRPIDLTELEVSE